MLILLLKFSRKAPKVTGRGIECQQEDFQEWDDLRRNFVVIGRGRGSEF